MVSAAGEFRVSVVFFDSDFPADSYMLMLPVRGKYGFVRSTSARAAACTSGLAELKRFCRSSESGVPGYGALILRVRMIPTPRVASTETEARQPLPTVCS